MGCSLPMGYPIAKRMLDKTVAAFLLVLVSPAIAVLLVAMAIDMLINPADRGSFLYRERRISRGRPFDLLKFRTLRADVRTGGHARLYEADAENLTWAGRRLIKPWYLDEVPQLLNVLRGEMSLVGPRPWPPQMVELQLAEGVTYRNEIPAGLTGLAQLSKGSDQLFAELDAEYVERTRTLSGWALVRYDVGILLSTVRVIARGQGLNY
jgi:lipopolysaccharide/colanic/teichoic acid biosynthesis glycosyltransferase